MHLFQSLPNSEALSDTRETTLVKHNFMLTHNNTHNYHNTVIACKLDSLMRALLYCKLFG